MGPDEIVPIAPQGHEPNLSSAHAPQARSGSSASPNPLRAGTSATADVERERVSEAPLSGEADSSKVGPPNRCGAGARAAPAVCGGACARAAGAERSGFCRIPETRPDLDEKIDGGVSGNPAVPCVKTGKARPRALLPVFCSG
jgi:hypothetical protein